MPEERTIEFLKTQGLWRRGARCLVAVSGGVDSVVLLHVLVNLRDIADLRLYAAHLDHGIRVESGADAAFVQRLCEQLKVPCTVGRTQVESWSSGKSLEMAARDIRRSFLAATRDACGAEIILTAHHGDDQLETLLLRLTRGTSLTGLKGISPMKDGVARPLLTLSRLEIEEYARKNGLTWVEDASNRDDHFDRNRIRHHITPVLKELNPQLIGAVNRLSEHLRRDEEFIALQLQDHLQSIQRIPRGVCWKIQPLHPALFSRVMTALMDQSGMTQIRSQDVESLTQLALQSKNGQQLTLPQGYMARHEGNHLFLFRPLQVSAPEAMLLSIPGETCWGKGCFVVGYSTIHDKDEPFIQHFDADRLPTNIQVRTRRAGDTIFPLGAPGHMSLKKAMSMRKIPTQARDSWPILAEGDRVLWVPGGNLMDKDIACSEQTRRLLKIQYHGEEISYYGTYSR